MNGYKLTAYGAPIEPYNIIGYISLAVISREEYEALGFTHVEPARLVGEHGAIPVTGTRISTETVRDFGSVVVRDLHELMGEIQQSGLAPNGERHKPEPPRSVSIAVNPEYSHLTRKEREKVLVLRKRLEHLRKRIAGSTQRLTYDEAEVKALEWALGKIAQMNPDSHHEPD